MWKWLRRGAYEPESDEGQRALERAERDLADARGRWALINSVAAYANQLQRENHFAERFAAAYRMGR